MVIIKYQVMRPVNNRLFRSVFSAGSLCIKGENMTKGLKLSSVFKLTFISSACTITALQMIYALSALFLGTESTITFNDEPLSGIKGFMFSLVALPFIIGIFGGFIAVTVTMGQWLYTRFAPLKLEFAE
jgi:hypothetical protein